MPRLAKRIEVEAPLRAVFEFLDHVERQPRWLPGERRVARMNGESGVGAVVHHESEAVGTQLSWDAVIEAWEPSKRIAWRQLKGDWAKHEGQWVLEPLGPNRTAVNLDALLELPHVLDAEVTREAADLELSHALDEALFNLKEELEG